MPQVHAGKDADAVGARRYERHRPERTLLYQLVEQHYPEFAEAMAAQGKRLPAYVEREFEDYLKCGRLEQGFLRVRCEACHAERLVAFSAIAPALLSALAPASLYLLHLTSRDGGNAKDCRNNPCPAVEL